MLKWSAFGSARSAYPIIPPPGIVTSLTTAIHVPKPTKSSSQKIAEVDGELRIIGGQWRGRKLQFPPLPGLRPSPNRVRETLFNWLAPEITGARCLDLFAGSGALGLEALSRGAGNCTFVENARAACERIAAHLKTLKSDNGSVCHANAAQWLQQKPNSTSQFGARFDIVFLDPPFRQDFLRDSCEQLERNDWLADRAWIYIESAADEALPPLPATWTLHRDKRAGKVAYRLFLRVAAPGANG